MRKQYLFWILLSVLVIVVVVLMIFGKKDDLAKIDVTVTDFDYEVDVCDEYFELVECIINNDTDENYTKQMKIDLKNEVMQIQEYWKSLGKDELFSKCSEELSKFDNDIMREKLISIKCLKK